MKHRHRILPGHMGGTYDPDNVILVEVTKCDRNRASHSMWHFASWQLWNKEEDRIAWKSLAGQLGQEERIHALNSLAGKKRQELYPNLSSQIIKRTKPVRKRKKVLCVETGVIYPGVRETSLQTGINMGSISQCCHGKKKSAGGYTWRFTG